ncbi:MAG: MBL fold metallo-hydrolase [Candidatus Heimdallarchaeota archaeon]|nr:MAG: MBL fold metallo-hydrolase [Candidatus Heimdallarchaeota archaeon]
MKQIIHGITWMLGQGLDCNVYIIESKGKSLMIDSGLGARMTFGFGDQKSSIKILENAIINRKINQIFLTHGHIDHVGGIMALQSKLDLDVITSEIEAQHLKSGDSSYIEPFMASKCSPIDISQEVFEGDVLHVGNFSFRVLHTPGHTHGSISLWDEKNQILISGDTVFPQGSFGRTDLHTGNSKDLVESLRRLSELDINVLLPGHMPPVISTSGSPLNSVKQSFQNARMMLTHY